MTGRVALVTGGAGGIGAAICRRLAADGANVAVGDADLGAVRPPAREIDGLALELDVTDRGSVMRAVSAVEETLGPVEILVNNAGIDRFGAFVDSTPEEWDRIIAVNLTGTISVTHAIFQTMIAGRNGVIVNVASDAGKVGSSFEAVYSASKGGVIAFTKALAREGASYGVRVNAVAPGPTDTALLLQMDRDMGERGTRLRDALTKAVPLKRVARPEEIAAAVSFLASDDASFVTGQALSVSGGLTMC